MELIYIFYFFHFNIKNKEKNKIKIICITSSVLEESCENNIYDIIPVLFVEGLNSAKNLRVKHNIYYLSIEEQNQIFP